MFKIGEFAAITQVAVSQLRYYAEIDLLPPAYTDPDTGYRYYTADQIPLLNQIITLKDLGFSLDQIRSLSHASVGDGQLRSLLEHQREQTLETIKDEIARLRQIESHLEELNAADHTDRLPAHRIVLKPLPEQRYLAIRKTTPHPQMTDLLSQIYAARGQVFTRKQPHLLTVFHTQPPAETVDWEIGYTVDSRYRQAITTPSGLTLTVRTLPAVEHAAALVYDGAWDGGRSATIALGRWIEQNRYQIAGSFRKLFLKLNDPAITPRAVVEIQIPVEPIELNI